MIDVEALKKRHGPLYVTEIEDDPYLWRPLTRPEWLQILGQATDDYTRWELVCQRAVVFPEGIDFGQTAPAGLASIIGPEIEELSGLGSPSRPLQLLMQERARMQGFEAQMEVMISTAFPTITFEQMESWPLEKLIKYLARAEWSLKTIHGSPIELEVPTGEAEAEDVEQPEEPLEPPVRTVEQVTSERDMGDPMLTRFEPPKSDSGFVELPFILGTKAWRKEGTVNVRSERELSRRPTVPPVSG